MNKIKFAFIIILRKFMIEKAVTTVGSGGARNPSGPC